MHESVKSSALCRKRPNVLPILFWNQNVGMPCVGGVVFISDEGETVLGDVENQKMSMFWTLFFVFFFMGETFLDIWSGHASSDTSLRRQMMESGREVVNRQNVLWDWPVEWESIKYKGKRPCVGFAQLLPHSLPYTYQKFGRIKQV